jgi:hypothetical protein
VLLAAARAYTVDADRRLETRLKPAVKQ